MGGLFGGKPKKPNIQEPKQFAMYDANKHGADVKPLERNPNLLGGPGIEALLAQWDAESKTYEAANAKLTAAREQGVEHRVVSRLEKPFKGSRDRLVSIENKMWDGIYQAPAGYGAPAPAPAATPKPAAPAPAPVFTPPAPESSPAAAAAGTIVGTQLTGTMGADTANTGTKRGGGRRGRVKSLLSGLGGSGSETFGG